MEPGRATFCAAEGGVGGLSWKTVEKLKEMRNFYLNVAWGGSPSLNRITYTKPLKWPKLLLHRPHN